MTAAAEPKSGELTFERKGDLLVAHLAGAWTLAAHPAEGGGTEPEIDRETTSRLTFDTTALADWDSALLTFLLRLIAACRLRNIEVDRGGLPAGVQRLLELAEAVPQRSGGRREQSESSLERIGDAILRASGATVDGLEFLGESVLALANLVVGRARYRAGDLFVHVQQAGAEALPIVSLISFLVGLIFAFVGAVQLQQFGATIYVANLVGISMVPMRSRPWAWTPWSFSSFRG